MRQREGRIARVVADLRPDVRGFLLEAIMAPPARQAELVGRLHADAMTPDLKRPQK